MKIAQIIEQVQRAMQGGVAPDDSRLNDEDYLASKVDQYSAKAISLAYTGSKTLGRNMSVDPRCYISFDLEYELALQETGACYVRFQCPEMIQIASYLDGFSFVGDKLTMTPLSKLKSPAEMATLRQIGAEGIGGVYFGVVGDILYVFGNRDQKQLSVIGRPKNPMGLNTEFYDPETDEYPMPDELVPLMIQIMRAEEFGIIAATPQDNVADENGQTLIIGGKK